MRSRGGRQCLPPSSRRERQIEAGSVVRFASAAYTNISPVFSTPSSLNRVQGPRRLGVLGLWEAMGYAMTCRRRACGHGEAPAGRACLVAAGTECGGGIVNQAAGKDGVGLAARAANWHESNDRARARP